MVNRDSLKQQMLLVFGSLSIGLGVGAAPAGTDEVFVYRHVAGTNIEGCYPKNYAIDLSRAYLGQGKNPPGYIGECSNFRGADLRSLDLSNLNLRGSTFENADLRGQTLVLSDRLANSTFLRADLRGAKISGNGHWGLGIHFIGADLRGADLSGVSSDLYLSSETLSAALYDEHTVFPSSGSKSFTPEQLNAVRVGDKCSFFARSSLIDDLAYKIGDFQRGDVHPLAKPLETIYLDLQKAYKSKFPRIIARADGAFRDGRIGVDQYFPVIDVSTKSSSGVYPPVIGKQYSQCEVEVSIRTHAPVSETSVAASASKWDYWLSSSIPYPACEAATLEALLKLRTGCEVP